MHARVVGGVHLEFAPAGSSSTGARMSAKEKFIVGVDLGGTNIVAGAMPVDGSREIAMHTIPTLAEGGAHSVTDRIGELIEQVVAQTMSETGAKRGDFLGVGIGSPGPPNRVKRFFIVRPNLRSEKYPPRDAISASGQKGARTRNRRNRGAARAAL